MSDEVIVRNSARCLTCGDEIESRHRHDFVTCSCGALSVDGGTAYLRRVLDESGHEKGAEDTSILVEDEPRTHTLEHSGITLDGVHHSAVCEGRPCPIHNRSSHALRSWGQVFYKGRIYRVDPASGEWTLDPDDPAAVAMEELVRLSEEMDLYERPCRATVERDHPWHDHRCRLLLGHDGRHKCSKCENEWGQE